MIDPQEPRVTKLESEFDGSNKYDQATRKSLDLLLADVCKYYGIDIPKLIIVNRKRGDPGWYLHSEIVLNRKQGGANTHTLLHEAAHWIVDCVYDEDPPPHGKEFVAIYMHLLDVYDLMPVRLFRVLARTHRVKIGKRYSPRAFRTTYS